jgi:hypothetical protein
MSHKFCPSTTILISCAICGEEQRFHEEDKTKCNQMGCQETATRIVYWPGKVPPPIMCFNHAIQALRIMDALGLPIVCEQIKPN